METQHPRGARQSLRSFTTSSKANRSGAPTISPANAPRATRAPIRIMSLRQWRLRRRPTRMPRRWRLRP
eukprot:1390684-Lingulodinium_polyedra.AAC.1